LAGVHMPLVPVLLLCMAGLPDASSGDQDAGSGAGARSSGSLGSGSQPLGSNTSGNSSASGVWAGLLLGHQSLVAGSPAKMTGLGMREGVVRVIAHVLSRHGAIPMASHQVSAVNALIVYADALDSDIYTVVDHHRSLLCAKAGSAASPCPHPCTPVQPFLTLTGWPPSPPQLQGDPHTTGTSG
jgi:hypothetical protein